MDDPRLRRQGVHAALIRTGPLRRGLKHFPVDPAEMLQEIRPASR